MTKGESRFEFLTCYFLQFLGRFGSALLARRTMGKVSILHEFKKSGRLLRIYYKYLHIMSTGSYQEFLAVTSLHFHIFLSKMTNFVPAKSHFLTDDIT